MGLFIRQELEKTKYLIILASKNKAGIEIA